MDFLSNETTVAVFTIIGVLIAAIGLLVVLLRWHINIKKSKRMLRVKIESSAFPIALPSLQFSTTTGHIKDRDKINLAKSGLLTFKVSIYNPSSESDVFKNAKVFFMKKRKSSNPIDLYGPKAPFTFLSVPSEGFTEYIFTTAPIDYKSIIEDSTQIILVFENKRDKKGKIKIDTYDTIAESSIITYQGKYIQ